MNGAGLALLRSAGRRAARSRHQAQRRRSTTGTCPPPSTTAAAGSTAMSPSWFAEYACDRGPALDDRVAMWATLNEPWVVTDGGYLHGALAPGHRNLFETPIATHNLLRAHGAGMQAYRAAGGKQAGLVVNLEPKYPASQLPGRSRRDPPRRCLHEPPVPRSGLPGPLSRGAGRDLRRGLARHFRPAISTLISAADRLRWASTTTPAAWHAHDPKAWPVRRRAGAPAAAPYTEMDWEVYPRGA